MTSNLIYANERYAVKATENPITIEGVDFAGSYELTNNDTGIVEFRSPCLPEVLRIAVHWDIALTQEQHLWPYEKLADRPVGENPPSGELLQ